jgi:hypothetical protein
LLYINAQINAAIIAPITKVARARINITINPPMKVIKSPRNSVGKKPKNIVVHEKPK